MLGSIYHYRGLLRILDVYGTEPQFNHPVYNPQRGDRTWGGKDMQHRKFCSAYKWCISDIYVSCWVQRFLLTVFEGKGLNPAQFFTHFPHSPDNSFLGFVVEKRQGRQRKVENK